MGKGGGVLILFTLLKIPVIGVRYSSVLLMPFYNTIENLHLSKC
jgi:hypothetical protein